VPRPARDSAAEGRDPEGEALPSEVQARASVLGGERRGGSSPRDQYFGGLRIRSVG
jgi:hypothetical protein